MEYKLKTTGKSNIVSEKLSNVRYHWLPSTVLSSSKITRISVSVSFFYLNISQTRYRSASFYWCYTLKQRCISHIKKNAPLNLLLRQHFRQDFSWSLGLKAITVTNNTSAIFVFNLLFKIEVQLPQDFLILEDLDFQLVKSNVAGEIRLDIISGFIKEMFRHFDDWKHVSIQWEAFFIYAAI